MQTFQNGKILYQKYVFENSKKGGKTSRVKSVKIPQPGNQSVKANIIYRTLSDDNLMSFRVEHPILQESGMSREERLKRRLWG